MAVPNLLSGAQFVPLVTLWPLELQVQRTVSPTLIRTGSGEKLSEPPGPTVTSTVWPDCKATAGCGRNAAYNPGKSVSCDSGIAIVEPGVQPRPGDVVAALIDGQVTLKTFLLQRGKPYLRAENPRYSNLIPQEELQIQGVMVALVRKRK